MFTVMIKKFLESKGVTVLLLVAVVSLLLAGYYYIDNLQLRLDEASRGKATAEEQLRNETARLIRERSVSEDYKSSLNETEKIYDDALDMINDLEHELSARPTSVAGECTLTQVEQKESGNEKSIANYSDAGARVLCKHGLAKPELCTTDP